MCKQKGGAVVVGRVRYDVCRRCALWWHIPSNSLLGNTSFMLFGCLIRKSCPSIPTMILQKSRRAVCVFYLFYVLQGHDEIPQHRSARQLAREPKLSPTEQMQGSCITMFFRSLILGRKICSSSTHISFTASCCYTNNHALATHQPPPLFIIARAPLLLLLFLLCIAS